jgi:hypothetical protein
MIQRNGRKPFTDRGAAKWRSQRVEWPNRARSVKVK